MDDLANFIGIVGGIQFLLVLLLVAVALLAPASFSGVFDRFEKRLAPFAQSPGLHLLLVFALGIGLRLALLPWLGPPPAFIADEFGLKLQAELMLQGRWAAPADPMWRHFEEMHILVTPVYSSIYFPGRIAPLALGMGLTGHAWAGMLLTMAALATAITWMLQAWVRPLTALLCGIMVVFQFGIFSYWVNGYWGGTVTALGAALVLGAAGRLASGARWQHGLWAGLGVLLMMTSRPFEGALFCVGIGLALLPWAWRSIREAHVGRLARFGLPVLALAAVGAGILASQAMAVSGSPLKPPYAIGREQYAGAPAFLFFPPIEDRQWPDEHLTRRYQYEAIWHERALTLPGLVKTIIYKLFRLSAFYVGPVLLIPLLAGLFSADRRAAAPLLAGGAVTAGFLVTTWDFPHYAAPLLPCVMLFVALGLQWLRGFRVRGRPSGLFLARTIPLLVVLNLVVPLAFHLLGRSADVDRVASSLCCALQQTSARNLIMEMLEATPGRDLVFVRYDEESGLNAFGVSNGARPEAQSILWARDLGDEANRQLVARFPDRQAWIVLARDNRAPGGAELPRPYRP